LKSGQQPHSTGGWISCSIWWWLCYNFKNIFVLDFCWLLCCIIVWSNSNVTLAEQSFFNSMWMFVCLVCVWYASLFMSAWVTHHKYAVSFDLNVSVAVALYKFCWSWLCNMNLCNIFQDFIICNFWKTTDTVVVWF
jgi:hypothetical protein